MQIRKEIQTEMLELLTGIQVIEISGWCGCKLGDISIPRKIQSEENESIIWHIESLKNNNITWEEINLQNTSKGILGELREIKREYELAKNYNNQSEILQFKTKINFITIVTTSGVLTGIIIVTILGILIRECKKAQKIKEGKKLKGKIAENHILTINLA